MALSSINILVVVSSSFCVALILIRCAYRLLYFCRIHTTCHRTWHADDTIIALAIIPLIARATCIVVSFDLNPSQTFSPPSPSDVLFSGLTAAHLEKNYIIARKLLIPARISYALLYVQ